ncbi:hypothetical protein AA0120_g3331 [Alternaria tenuissima]|nr:hypothetical protein AA0120_g3331 [Alternaria tenuissima]
MRDEEQGLQILDTRTGSGSAQEGAEPPFRPEPEAPSSEDRSHSCTPDSWGGTSAAGRRRDLKEFHIGLESESGAPSYETARRAKKQDI